MVNERPAKIGLLLIGSPRFKQLGEGTEHGTYGERKLIEEKEIIKNLEKMGEVVYTGITYEREDVDKAISAFFNEKVDCVIASYLSWAEDFAWIRFLRNMPEMPVLLASFVREGVYVTDTNDEDQFLDFLSAGALVGVQESSGDFARFNRPMKDTILGTMDVVMEKAKVFIAAAKARSVLRDSTVGLLACFNEAMWSTYLDPYNVFQKVGPELHFLSVAELCDEIEQVTDEELKKVTDEIKASFKFYPNVDYEKFDASVKASIAVEKLSAKYGLDLTVLNDIDTVLFGHVGLRPGFMPTTAESKLTCVPEGDIGNGLATYILRLLSGGKRANFIEPFYIVKNRNCIACGHAGPNDYRGDANGTIVARDERFAKSKWKYAGAPFAWYVFPEGEYTVLHMSENNGKMKMVCLKLTAIPTKHYLASYSHADFVHETLSPEEVWNELIKIGVNQHYGIVPGDYTKEVEQLADMLGFEYHFVG